KVHIVANPATGKHSPVLRTLNDHFRPAGIHWQVSVTHDPGDGARLAREAVDSGAEVIGVFGGDGTIRDVASALIGSEIPMLILGGGTGNLMATELNLPLSLNRACRLICGKEYQTRDVDVGKMGEHYFLHRIGCGIESDVLNDASREMKKQFGKWAYIFASVKALQEIPVADYTITLDEGETIKGRGVACAVANAGAIGIGKLTLSKAIGLDDGKLDVILLRTAHLEGIISLARMIMGIESDGPQDPDLRLDASDLVNHWQVRSVRIESDPIQKIQADGDLVARTPQLIEVLPGALRVVI
ncbi:MAG: diacylglycerol kinase family protein, partial [Verrucomicrobiales bacterium]